MGEVGKQKHMTSLSMAYSLSNKCAIFVNEQF